MQRVGEIQTMLLYNFSVAQQWNLSDKVTTLRKDSAQNMRTSCLLISLQHSVTVSLHNAWFTPDMEATWNGVHFDLAPLLTDGLVQTRHDAAQTDAMWLAASSDHFGVCSIFSVHRKRSREARREANHRNTR